MKNHGTTYSSSFSANNVVARGGYRYTDEVGITSIAFFSKYGPSVSSLAGRIAYKGDFLVIESDLKSFVLNIGDNGELGKKVYKILKSRYPDVESPEDNSISENYSINYQGEIKKIVSVSGLDESRGSIESASGIGLKLDGNSAYSGFCLSSDGVLGYWSNEK